MPINRDRLMKGLIMLLSLGQDLNLRVHAPLWMNIYCQILFLTVMACPLQMLLFGLVLQGASKNLNLMEWNKMWAINKKIIDPMCPRYTAVIQERRALLVLTDGPKDPFVRILAKCKKYEGAGVKAVTYSNRLWIDYADDVSILVGEEVTLKD